MPLKSFDTSGSSQKASTPLSGPGESLLRFVKKDHAALSEEALYWARFVRDASLRFDDKMTFQDTVIVNPLFMPLLFKGNILPKDLTFYDFSALKSKNPYSQYYKADSVFKDLERVNKITEIARAVSLWRPLVASQDELAQKGIAFLKKIFV